MFRGLIMVLATGLGLLAAMIFVIGIGMRRFTASQKAYDAAWHAPAQAALIPATQAAPAIPASEVETSALPKITSIDLWARDATLHGMVQLADGGAPPPEARVGKRGWGGRQLTARLTGFYKPTDSAEWVVEIPKAGEYEFDLTCAYTNDLGRYIIKIGNQELVWAPTTETRNVWHFRSVTMGKLMLPVGKTTLTLAPGDGPTRSNLMVRHLEIIPLARD